MHPPAFVAESAVEEMIHMIPLSCSLATLVEQNIAIVFHNASDVLWSYKISNQVWIRCSKISLALDLWRFRYWLHRERIKYLSVMSHLHYKDVTMSTMASQITMQPHHCLLNCLFKAQTKEKSNSTLLAFVRGIHRWPVSSPNKGTVTRTTFPFDDVIMLLVSSAANGSEFQYVSRLQASDRFVDLVCRWYWIVSLIEILGPWYESYF